MMLVSKERIALLESHRHRPPVRGPVGHMLFDTMDFLDEEFFFF
jgi:hypothetical protein